MTGSSTRPTLEAVAARAGVGRGTVSRVVNGSPRVSAQAREAVLKAIEELGYVPNRAARTLVTRRTDTVALVVAESDQRLFDEPYFAGIIRGISNGLADTGLQLLLALARSPAEYGRLEEYLTTQHVDGVLLTSLHAEDPLPAKLEANGVPTVLGGRPPGLSPVSYVDVDNRSGAREAVTHLISGGRRRIATIAGPQDMGVGLDRLAGYREALAEAGLPEYVEYGDFGEASGIIATERLLAAEPALDAVFAADDPMALGALRVLRRHGRRVPGDVAVIGFDDSAAAPLADPPLTTVHQSVGEMGVEMARLLVSRIRGETVADPVVIMRPHLVLRESA
ncbi:MULTISPECIES: LacI family DNA-binding transcriptional regulator [Actinomadura]|uniref:DNA-binding LacI/PurR family transcriptional regulator n=1 Tax=Actinomadura livida TaxID=79909 RepID=A0A7W7IBX8_9ACTN|nr:MULTISPECIES: LacI family DNA-binding transcriptional regulator [Actinomadura]MBB4774119.1 DNA-binding LacI/PurR family transcriptional regulator [Actinomadura catellatispora]TDB92733.1 LacI family transcriptional regulator [Actinomadura sp. 7K534]GGT84748.1 LacI family transcriptional regulator [Actinomadura livida]